MKRNKGAPVVDIYIQRRMGKRFIRNIYWPTYLVLSFRMAFENDADAGAECIKALGGGGVKRVAMLWKMFDFSCRPHAHIHNSHTCARREDFVVCEGGRRGGEGGEREEVDDGNSLGGNSDLLSDSAGVVATLFLPAPRREIREGMMEQVY